MSSPARIRISVHVVRCLIVLAVTAVGTVFGCGGGPPASIGSASTSGDSSSHTGDSAGPKPSSGCTTAQVHYADVAPIFASHCTSCHATTVTGRARNGAPVGVDFNVYANAAADASWAASAVRSGMPPGARLSSADICTITTWASQGAPE
jgi:uncharacterized membrane protein